MTTEELRKKWITVFENDVSLKIVFSNTDIAELLLLLKIPPNPFTEEELEDIQDYFKLAFEGDYLPIDEKRHNSIVLKAKKLRDEFAPISRNQYAINVG